MSVYNIKIANTVIGIETAYVLPYALARAFFTEEEPDIRITSTQEDINSEKQLYEEANGLSISWDGAVETAVVLRKVADSLIEQNTFLMHGAAIALNNRAYLFTANSGVGKTTHIRKWLRNLPEAFVVNGDKPFVLTGEVPYVCSSPWAGKEGMYTNTMVPLSGIVLLERSDDNQINEISIAEAFPTLFQQVYRPADEDKMRKTLALLKSLDGKVGFYRFKMNNYKDDCFQVAYEALTGKKI